MKKTLLLLSLALTVTMAESIQKDIKTEVKMQTSSTIVTREVRTFRAARSSREIRIQRTNSSSSKEARVSRPSRVQRLTHHVVKMPKSHLASLH